MVEQGVVKSVKKGVAVVTVDKKIECSKCGMCAFPKNANKIDIIATNDLGAKQGDCVEIENSGEGKLTGALLAFLVPLILIGVAGLIGMLILKSELWTLGLSVVFIALWYVFLGLIDKKLAFLKRFNAKVTKIIESGESEIK